MVGSTEEPCEQWKTEYGEETGAGDARHAETRRGLESRTLTGQSAEHNTSNRLSGVLSDTDYSLMTSRPKTERPRIRDS